MTVQKVEPERNKRRKLSYDEWIDENLKRICEHKNGRIVYVNRMNQPPDKYEVEKLIDELYSLDLADADRLDADLLKKGEEACRAGGWIGYLNQKGKDTEVKPKSFLEKIKSIHKTTVWIGGGIIMFLTIVVLWSEARETLLSWLYFLLRKDNSVEGGS